MDQITPEIVREYKEFTPKFLCPISANIYKIKFKRFKVRDLDTDFVLFDVSDDSPDSDNENNNNEEENNIEIEEEDILKSPRTIRYHLGPDFLDLKNLGSSLTFSVGNEPVKDFLIIERHYFNDLLIKSFEFKFDFCIPNSTNTWEYIYNIPDIDNDIKRQMIEQPWNTRSDSS